MRKIIIRNIDNAPNGKEFFAGISGNFKDFGQTLCELIDNPISNFRAHGIRGRVEIVLEEQGDRVDVMVRDNGTGIENMDAALTIAARSCAESTLNEHGMGLKHALASINAGADQHWSIQTRTAEDVAKDRYQRAEGPYDIHMPVSMMGGGRRDRNGGAGALPHAQVPDPQARLQKGGAHLWADGGLPAGDPALHLRQPAAGQGVHHLLHRR